MARTRTDSAPSANGQDPTYTPPPDLSDIDNLWIKTDQGDPLTTVTLHQVPVGKPRDFFRTVPDISYREKTEIYVHKPENTMEETTYIIGPALRGQIEEAQPCLLVTVVDRAGNPRLWPIKLPKDDGKDNVSWSTLRSIARTGLIDWVKAVWVSTGAGFKERKAEPGYAPDPDFSKLPPFRDLAKAGFGEHGIIWDKTHPIYRDLFGLSDPRENGHDTDPLL
jgi:hypothetical protein